MSVFLVTYDLNKETTRPNITKKIKDDFSWARLSESSYAIETYMSAEEIFDILQPMIDSNDNLYVIPLKKPHVGFGPKDVNEWLDDNLTY